MAARENERPNVTTMLVQNANDISDDEEMSDATDEKDEDHKRAGVSPIHVPADWEKTDSTGNADSVCQQSHKYLIKNTPRSAMRTCQ